MYILSMIFLVLSAMLTARLFVAIAAHRSSKRIGRAVFWLGGIPLGLLSLFVALCLVGDDRLIFHSPRYFLAVMLPPTIFLLSLVWFGVTGFRSQQAISAPRART